MLGLCWFSLKDRDAGTVLYLCFQSGPVNIQRGDSVVAVVKMHMGDEEGFWI